MSEVATAPAPAPVAAPVAVPVAAPAAAPAPAPAPAPAAAPAASVLASSNPDAIADPWVDVPEKFQVKKEDGTLDQTATFAKVREAHAQAEKRIGSGDARPYRAVDYKVEVPETMKEAFDEADPVLAEFKKTAHAAGFSQKQFDTAMGKFFELAPTLVGGAVALDQAAATAQLEGAWGKGESFKANAGLAFRAVQEIGGKDLSEQLERELGNSPAFLQFAARVGAQLGEDHPPADAGGAVSDDIITLQSSEAYRNAKHPQHASVSAKVHAFYARKPGAGEAIG